VIGSSENVLSRVEVEVPSEAFHYVTGNGGFGNISAQLKNEPIRPVTD